MSGACLITLIVHVQVGCIRAAAYQSEMFLNARMDAFQQQGLTLGNVPAAAGDSHQVCLYAVAQQDHIGVFHCVMQRLDFMGSESDCHFVAQISRIIFFFYAFLVACIQWFLCQHCGVGLHISSVPSSSSNPSNQKNIRWLLVTFASLHL